MSRCLDDVSGLSAVRCFDAVETGSLTWFTVKLLKEDSKVKEKNNSPYASYSMLPYSVDVLTNLKEAVWSVLVHAFILKLTECALFITNQILARLYNFLHFEIIDSILHPNHTFVKI